MKRRCGTLLLVLSVLTGSLYAKTLYVDDDAPGDPGPCNCQISDPNEDGSADHPFDSIQEAIDAASDSPGLTSTSPRVGDTIIVAPGHYLSPDPWEYDEIRFKGKAIRLISSAPTDFSVIEQTVLCGVVIFEGNEGSKCLLQGFKIHNYGHGGILGNLTLATISHCIISGNGPCGATVIKDCRGPIRNCLIVDNKTFFTCGLMPVISGCPELVNCTIANNASGVFIGTNLTYSGSHGIYNCIIYGNGGLQVMYDPDRSAPALTVNHCLIEDWGSLELYGDTYKIKDCDPCFVQPGEWLGSGTESTLIEGDYHLKSEGWRWSASEMTGSHWRHDLSTSPAVDAGRLIDGLGEEPERLPEDLDGRWGVNHAIDIGAYGGTTQGSLSPTKGTAPGVGSVDLRDYWPIASGNQWYTDVPDWDLRRSVRILGPQDANGFEAYMVSITTYNDTSHRWAYCAFVNDGLSVTEDPNALMLLPQITEPLQMRYPQFLTVGVTILVPDDPFAIGTPAGRSVTIVRGNLTEVHAGVPYDPPKYISHPTVYPWPDVIAFRLQNADGTLGEPIAIFARGFGPLMLNGQVVGSAYVDGDSYSRFSR